MSAMLDRWMGSRKLEKKRHQAMNHDLDARFGDVHITAPTTGGWNQTPSSDDAASSASTAVSRGGPNLSRDQSLAERRLPVENGVEDKQKRNVTITIPIPWASRKPRYRVEPAVNNKALVTAQGEQPAEPSPRSLMSSPEPTPSSFMSSPDLNAASVITTADMIVHSRTASPVAIYKPISEEYKQELAAMTRGISRARSASRLHPDRIQNVSPVVTTDKLTSGDVAKEMAEIGMGPSPTFPHREGFSRSPIPSQTSPEVIASYTRLAPAPEQQSAPVALPPDPRPTLVSYLTEPAPSMVGLPLRPRLASERSNSQGPSTDRGLLARHAHKNPPVDRARPTRSSSRAALPERTGTTRSSSQAPAQKRMGTIRSSSHGPTYYGRSASHSGPLEKCTDTSNTTSHVRSTSHVPISIQLSSHESSSSVSPGSETCVSTSSSPSLDSEPGPSPTIGSNPNIIDPVLSVGGMEHAGHSNKKTTTMTTSSSTGSSTKTRPALGYYASISQEYRRIASDLEESEHERRRQRRREAEELVPDSEEWC